jgi:enoyl-CoA hydratase/carnithine racemase
MTGHLIVSDEEATRVITLRRPEKKNAITQDMYRAMSDAIDKAQKNPDIRCIITGGSGVFTAAGGHDTPDRPGRPFVRRTDALQGSGGGVQGVLCAEEGVKVV